MFKIWLTFSPSGGVDGISKIVWMVASNEENLYIFISSDEEEVGEVEVGIVNEGVVIYPLPPDVGDEFDDAIDLMMVLDDKNDADDEDVGESPMTFQTGLWTGLMRTAKILAMTPCLRMKRTVKTVMRYELN